mmetsp:Transcript_44322/g.104117  ORF Transcript_44322/g.104117 Transcript_44322/m.104117 type:complete len:171 (-) Transcript_44322:107-619(-)
MGSRLRPFSKADEEDIVKIFAHNLEEEWSNKSPQFLPNALKYVQEEIKPHGDLRNVDKVYVQSGGAFWVLADDDRVVGMVGLQVKSPLEGELRRMCLLPPYRRQGWGTKMVSLVKEHARSIGLQSVCLSTPEHGSDVLQFYTANGFVDTGRREPIHDSTVHEVYLVWHVS